MVIKTTPMIYLPLESQEEMDTLTPGEEIRHANYRICVVEKIIPDMGVILVPNNYSGSARFEMDTANLVGSNEVNVPLIEDDYLKISINRDARAKSSALG